MEVNFITRGRLGNAIFRYFACALMCILYDGTYICKNYYNTSRQFDFGEENFTILQNILLNNQFVEIKNMKIINMDCFYQHDAIYRKYKDVIISYIKKNPTHTIETDGINAGDGRFEHFTMLSIIETPIDFKKKYLNVLHLRLEDFVTHNLYLKVERVISILGSISQIENGSLCIVCKKPDTDFEINYVGEITKFLNTKNIEVVIESNDVLTDYHIMANSELLICSKSTLSWCAALLSTTIKTCYIPDGESFKYPIDNTHFY